MPLSPQVARTLGSNVEHLRVWGLHQRDARDVDTPSCLSSEHDSFRLRAWTLCDKTHAARQKEKKDTRTHRVDTALPALPGLRSEQITSHPRFQANDVSSKDSDSSTIFSENVKKMRNYLRIP